MRKVYGYLSIVIMVVLIWVSFWGSPFAINQAEKDTLAYLLQHGYQAEEISDIQGFYDRKDNKKYYVKVIFTDNLREEQVFAYDLAGNIYQVENIKMES